MGAGGNDYEFASSGPKHMMAKAAGAGSSPTIEIDWDNEEHRRCITACLVRGTYVLESDRTSGREGTPQALAPAWWESFHFRRLQPDYELECPCECDSWPCEISRRLFLARGTRFIYGAVFEYAPPDGGARRHPKAPRYVVAFRGTMPRDPTIVHDMHENVRILLNKQHLCGRFSHARQMVEKLLKEKKKAIIGSRGDVWLAGHSLGASIALDVGRHLVTSSNGRFNDLPTFLFNPPHVSLAPAISEDAREDVYAVGDFARYALGKVLKPHRKHMGELFEKLKPWAPNLYVNPRDDLCLGFIHYFEKREGRMREWFPGVAEAAATLSFRDMFHSALGSQTERQHLLPSAILWKNSSTSSGQDSKAAHKLRQWWQTKPELELSYEQYTWR